MNADDCPICGIHGHPCGCSDPDVDAEGDGE